MRDTLVFVVWPYAAAAMFIGGIALRYILARRQADLQEGDPEGFQSDPFLGEFAGSKAFRLSFWLLVVCHLAGLLLPRQILLWNSVATRLYLLEGVAFLIGLAALTGWSLATWRQLGRSGGASIWSEMVDTVFVSLLLVGVLSGLLSALLYRWGSSWAVVTLTPYLRSLSRGKPATGFASGMPFFVQLHVFSAFASVAALPFTRLGPSLAMVFQHSAGRIFKPLSTLARAGWATVEVLAERLNPAVWIWPEEED